MNRQQPKTVTNFGANLSFAPQQQYAPRCEADLLEVLRQNRGRRIRAIGRLHSWSEAPLADDVLLDLRHINDVGVSYRDGRHWVTVGAGCQIKQLLTVLDAQGAGTLPAIGLITEQTIAGAISTGTHGSGNYCISHFIEEVRVATYDEVTGEPVIRTVNAADELRAARCSLGTLGIIVSVSFWSRPQYFVEEHFQRYADICDVLRSESDYPLQQFFLLPWLWQYLVQHRRETSSGRGGWATLYRWYFFLVIDIALHLFVLLMVRIRPWPRAIRFFYRVIAPKTVIQNWSVADKAQRMLVMEHELFRHVECEIFVKRSRLVEAIAFSIALMKYFDGDREAIDSPTREKLSSLGFLSEFDGKYGSYTHHYPICVRRVLPDDMFISMASGGDESSYAISFISYMRPSQQASFVAFSEILTKTMAALFDGRPHWGKLCSLTPREAGRLYPQLAQFCEVANNFDPNGVFRNDWVSRTLFGES